MNDARVTTETTPGRVIAARSLAGEFRMLGLKAEAVENDMAVRVSSELGSHVVWLPDDRWGIFVWGIDFQHEVPGTFSHAEVALAVKGTL
jgi:hypothetical protein